MAAYRTSKQGLTEGIALVDYLTQYKKNQHAELIANIGIHVAQNYPNKLSDSDFADKVEDFFMACLELKLIDWAELFFKSIANNFPDGIKTMRLMAMLYEAQGATLRAQEIY